MTKYILLGLEGESRVLVVDCEAMTVGEVDSASAARAVAGEVDDLEHINQARASGQKVIRGVDLAIAAGQRPTASFAFASSYPYTEPA